MASLPPDPPPESGPAPTAPDARAASEAAAQGASERAGARAAGASTSQESGIHHRGPVDYAADMIRRSLPYLKEWNARVAAWAAEASWKRISLLGLVVFIAAAIVSQILEVDEDSVVITGPNKPLKFDIKEDASGITIQPSVDGKQTKSARINLPPLPPATPESGGRHHSRDPGSAPSTDSPNPGEPVDKDAIQLEKDGKKIVIDSHGGVRVFDDSARTNPGKQGDVSPPPVAGTDAQSQDKGEKARAEEAKARAEEEKRRAEDGDEEAEEARQTQREQIQDAVEQAKSEIQDAVNEVATENTKRVTKHRESAAFWDFFKVLLTIAFAYLIAIKVSTSNKRRAEEMVKSASQLAEHESLQRQVVEARMQTMQAQVEPHFLFNTLSSVDYLIETDPARASTMQKNLIQYLRAALPQMRESSTTLGREVDLVRAYLDILKVRMEERLQVSIDVPEGLRSADFPPMMLQSLVENAIKHGLEPKAQGGAIRISGEVVDGDLHVTVADTGLGFNPAGAPTSGGGLGLANIRERLALLYSGRAKFVITANQPSGTLVAIVIPYQPMARRV